MNNKGITEDTSTVVSGSRCPAVISSSQMLCVYRKTPTYTIIIHTSITIPNPRYPKQTHINMTYDIRK
jgi:hypothetical protein